MPTSHWGNIEYRPLAELFATLSAAGVARAALVRHGGEFDNSYIGRAVVASPHQFAVVAMVDPTRDWESHWLAWRWAGSSAANA